MLDCDGRPTCRCRTCNPTRVFIPLGTGMLESDDTDIIFNTVTREVELVLRRPEVKFPPPKPLGGGR